jgi:hypothetical protein
VSLAGFFVASTVVTLLQFLRLRDWRLVPLLGVFACLALAHAQTDWYAARPYHLAAGVAGLVLLLVLSPRQRPSH